MTEQEERVSGLLERIARALERSADLSEAANLQRLASEKKIGALTSVAMKHLTSEERGEDWRSGEAPEKT